MWKCKLWFEELFVVAFKVLCVAGCGRASSGVTRLESGFTPEIATPSQNDQRQLGPLTRLLTQVERVLGVNNTQMISVEIVEAAQDSLFIGQA